MVVMTTKIFTSNHTKAIITESYNDASDYVICLVKQTEYCMGLSAIYDIKYICSKIW